jgi:hypothetical protein
MVLEHRQIKGLGTTSKGRMSVGRVQTIICQCLFKKVYAWWVPKMLMFDWKAQRVSVSVDYLNQTEPEGNVFLK